MSKRGKPKRTADTSEERKLKKYEHQVAYHEAGHAVIGLMCDPPIRHKHTTIIPDLEHGSAGHAEQHRSKARREEMEFGSRNGLNLRDSEAITLYAGRLAQAKYLGHTPRSGHEADYHDIARINPYGDPERQRLWARLRKLDAKYLTDRWWPQIQAVAARLIEKKTLSHDEVLEIIFPGAKESSTSLRAYREGSDERLPTDLHRQEHR